MTRVVIIGGGYGGLRALEKIYKANSDIEIVLFDIHPYHYMQTEVYDLIANKTDLSDITIDLFTYCSGFSDRVIFHKEKVININFDTKKLSSENRRISYDYLIIATGATTYLPPSIPGLKEYAHNVKNIHVAMKFKQQFERAILDRIEKEGDKVCTPFNIIVAGAGLSGVEIAAQMAHFSKEFYKKNNFLCRSLNIHLITSTDKVLKGLDNYLIDKSMQRLNKLGVNIIKNNRLEAVSEECITLSNGNCIPTDFLIFTGGLEPTPLLEVLSIQKSKKGYIETRDTLQVIKYDNVFAIGDCANIYDKAKNPLPATADIAEMSAELVATNIIALMENRDLNTHSIKSRGTLIALGGHYAVAKLGNIKASGLIAYIMKFLVVNFYSYKLKQICKKGYKKIFCSIT
jgi:NADH dehydrogenase